MDIAPSVRHGLAMLGRRRANGAREREDVRFETGVSEHFCTMIQRFTCGVDVVNNQHSLELSCYPVNTLPQRESITNIRRSPSAVEPALAGPVADTAQQGSIGEPGTACKP